MPPDFLSFFDLPGEQLLLLIDDASRFKRDFDAQRTPRLLEGKRIAAIWDAEGFRNRVAFELGARLLGAERVEVPCSFGVREDSADIARYLDNWFDAVIVRTPGHAALQAFADAASLPVINARTRHNHPCEVLGDLAFVHSQRGSIEGLNVVYVGAPTNLCHTWLEAGATMPINVTHVTPPGSEPDEALLQRLLSNPVGNVTVCDNLAGSLKLADVVYTDTWPSGTPPDVYLPYQISAALLDLTPASCLFLPCPPVHRGEEVSSDAMDSPRCRVYEAKEYLLHAQNALLVHLLT
jgi:ornithine carbamoyltransferase